MYKGIILISFMLTLGASLSAQPLRAITYETKLRVADESAKSGDYYSAIEWFDKAYDESRDQDLQVPIADLYMRARDYKRAEQIYARLLKRDKEKRYEDVRPALAEAIKSQGRYKEAREQMNIILQDAEVGDSIKNLVKISLDGIEKLDSYENNLEAVIELVKGKVNSASAESAPIFGPEGNLYFSSFNTRKEIIIDGKEGEYHAKLYTAALNDKGEYDKIEALSEAINRKGFNSGGVSFSRDGRKMYFTRATLQTNGLETSKIFVSNRTDAGWASPQEIDAFNGDFLSLHPVSGELFGKEVIFFASNRPGGLGGFDIYYSEVKGENYGLPVNLGDKINTANDELTPFYNSGSLYFSTNGRPGLGGFDIYYGIWNGSTWKDVSNIGYQYNTSYDDMFLRFDASGKRGFLVSNRPSKGKIRMKGSESCCDDIYSVGIRELMINLEAKVEMDKKPLAGASVEVYDVTQGGYPDIKTNLNGDVMQFSLNPERNYKVIATMDGFYPDSATFNTVGIIDDYVVKKSFNLRPKPKKDDVEIVKTNQSIRLNNIYYDLDKFNILPEAETDLGYLSDLMFEYPDLVIELSSHTDAQGDDPYNQKLSQKRAESARDWLINQKIDGKRIKAVGYGESKILNKCVNGVRCSDAEHRINRRTEFKILSGASEIIIKKSNFEDRGTQPAADDKLPPAPVRQKSTKGKNSNG